MPTITDGGLLVDGPQNNGINADNIGTAGVVAASTHSRAVHCWKNTSGVWQLARTWCSRPRGLMCVVVPWAAPCLIAVCSRVLSGPRGRRCDSYDTSLARKGQSREFLQRTKLVPEGDSHPSDFCDFCPSVSSHDSCHPLAAGGESRILTSDQLVSSTELGE